MLHPVWVGWLGSGLGGFSDPGKQKRADEKLLIKFAWPNRSRGTTCMFHIPTRGVLRGFCDVRGVGAAAGCMNLATLRAT